MIPQEKLVELSLLYEELMYSTDPLATNTVRAKLVFRSECRRLWESESEGFRKTTSLNAYTSTVVIVEILRYLNSCH